jgi:hypothetical protein
MEEIYKPKPEELRQLDKLKARPKKKSVKKPTKNKLNTVKLNVDFLLEK